MTLDEAIQHSKEVSINKRRRFEDIYGQENATEEERKEALTCLDCSNEHGQLVRWLEELKARREADRWIPVTERTPDEDVDVIVSDMETYETYSAYYVGDGYWACDNGTYKHRITHWKPFPKKCDESGETIGEKFLSGWRNKSETTNE